MTNEPVDPDGQSDLYKACASMLVDAEQQASNLIDSYVQSNKIKALNQQVAKPRRFQNIDSTNVDFNGYDIGNTPLHAAVQTGKLIIVQKLLKAGARADLKNYKGNTPLHEAVKAQNPAIVKELLRAGARVDIVNHEFDTPMISALDMVEDKLKNDDLKKIIKSLKKASVIEQPTKNIFNKVASFIGSKFSFQTKPSVDVVSTDDHLTVKGYHLKDIRKSPPLPEFEALSGCSPATSVTNDESPGPGNSLRSKASSKRQVITLK